MNDKDQIKELFSEKLGNYEAKVNPELWTNIASQIGAASTATVSTGVSLLAKAIIGISAAAVVTTGIILYSNSKEEAVRKEKTSSVNLLKDERVTDKEDASEIEILKDRKQENASKKTVGTNEKVKNGDTLSETTLASKTEDVVDNASDQGVTGVGTNNGSVSNQKVNGEKQIPSTLSKGKTGESDSMENPNENTKEHLTLEDDPLKSVDEKQPEEEKVAPFELNNLPNVFTPNGDFTNDYFELNLPELKSFTILIQDQRGQTVFESNDPHFRWDGTSMITGKRVEKGIHSYVIIAENMKGEVAKAGEFLMITFD